MRTLPFRELDCDFSPNILCGEFFLNRPFRLVAIMVTRTHAHKRKCFSLSLLSIHDE